MLRPHHLLIASLFVLLTAHGLAALERYVSLVAGKAFAERQVISPFVGMWMANAFLLAVVLLLVWRPGGPDAARGAESLAIGG
jgi:lipopolysaccharide export LptBFGC system permease protein LptF